MNYRAILHIQDSQYCYASDLKTIELMLRVSSEDEFDEISVIYGKKYDFYLVRQSTLMSKTYTDGVYDYYTVTIRPEDVRFVYVFRLIYKGEEYFFYEDGIAKSYDYSLAYYNCFQLPYVNKADVPAAVPWFKNAVFYQVFVDRFNRGNFAKDDSYINLKWGAVPSSKSFAGGDIDGITQKLDYLKGLGVSALYLTPVFKSASNHKYDISDYYEIDPQFGDKASLKRLVTEAHCRGIKVVLDAVFNHCSEELEQFKDVKKRGKLSPYFDWFYVEGDAIDFKKRNYQTFSLARYMPKLKVTNPETKAYLLEVVLHYLRLGIDGWRFDVGDEISHSFIRKVREKVKAAFPEALMLGEHWHNAHSFLRGDEYDGVMNYPFTYAAYDYIIYAKDDAKKSAFRLNELYTHYRFQNALACLNLLDSHDTHRFLNLARGNQAKLQCAIAMEFFFPGMSCLYYGTEIPMDGGFDPDCRRGFPYETALKGSKHMEVVKQLIKIRKDPRLGSYHFLAKEENGLLILSRGEGKTLKLAINQTGKDVVFDKAPIYSANLEGNLLHNDGFAIFE